MPAKPKDQLGMDEVVVDSADAEAALEARYSARSRLAVVRKEYQDRDAEAKGLLLPLTEGLDVVRIGRFRVTRTATVARSVSFETKASTRLRIEADDD